MQKVTDLRSIILSETAGSGWESSVCVCCRSIVISKQFSITLITASAVGKSCQEDGQGCGFVVGRNFARCHCTSILRFLPGLGGWSISAKNRQIPTVQRDLDTTPEQS